MPNLYDDSMLLTEARARAGQLQPRLEGPDQHAIDVLLGRLDHLEQVLDLTRRVRRAQTIYFRDKIGLVECRQMESRLDGMIKE